jgi:hypothetical protein
LIATVDAPAVALDRAAPPKPAAYRTAYGAALSFGKKQTIVCARRSGSLRMRRPGLKRAARGIAR